MRATRSSAALGDILEHLPRSGDFAVMELPRSLTVAGSAFALTSELERPALAFFLPLYSGEHQSLPGRVLVTLTSLEDLEIQAAASEAALLEATREKFGGMSLYRRGLVALLNRDGEILASGGDGQLPARALPRLWKKPGARDAPRSLCPRHTVICSVW